MIRQASYEGSSIVSRRRRYCRLRVTSQPEFARKRLVDEFRRRMESTKWIRSCFSKNDMLSTNGEMRFGALAREVFSWDAAIRWIALDDFGRQQVEWRDPDTEVAAATTPGHPLTVDPLLLMLAENRHHIYNSSDRADPPHLRFVVLAYRDRAQIVTKFGRYGQLNIGIGLAGNAYQVGTRLAGLLDSTQDW